jgi:predicted CXXCH cytochrome family protein
MKMEERMKKIVAILAMLALPAVAMAGGGIVGDCYDCHTMHNSENGAPIAIVNGAVSANPIENLLKLDCVACHANDPTGGTKLWTMTGGSVVPQVAHGGGADDLAGGNFSNGLGGNSSKVHNVVDLFAGQWDTNGGDLTDLGEFGAPPGTAPAAHYHGLSRGVFTTDVATPFDAFTCAGARGCHGTRSQILGTVDVDGNAATTNDVSAVRRTGITAVSGAHHASYDGVKESVGYNTAATDGATHNGQIVADGYRFIPGLFGYGNETTRWENVSSAQHNEYYGNAQGLTVEESGCSACHVTGTSVPGGSSRAAFGSTLRTPNNSMSGFCSTCHGNFHSAGGGDYVNNGVSGAFLRHPSDYVIPNSGEYAAYTTYDLSAPVARPSITGLTGSSATVTPGTDLVMCLSCHEAHGTANDYLLRFDYTTMTAGFYGGVAAAQTAGGCLACHTTKGVLPENR